MQWVGRRKRGRLGGEGRMGGRRKRWKVDGEEEEGETGRGGGRGRECVGRRKRPLWGLKVCI